MTSPLIDTHVHFWDLTHATLTYEWLAPESQHPILGNIDAIKSVRYDVNSLLAEARFAGVTAAVHVQAAVGTPDPVDETVWLNDMAATSPIPFTIIAGTDLSADDAAVQLDRHLAASPLMRGIRDFGYEGFLSDPRFRRGVRLLAERDLLLDLDCGWQDMGTARDLAEQTPSAVIVLEHIGYPRDTASPEYFASWKIGISELAKADNVYCKISGLGMNRAGWTVNGLRPWIEHCIAAFGPDRCVWGSNWPVDRLYGSYDAYASAFRELISGYSQHEQAQMLSGTASRIYGL